MFCDLGEGPPPSVESASAGCTQLAGRHRNSPLIPVVQNYRGRSGRVRPCGLSLRSPYAVPIVDEEASPSWPIRVRLSAAQLRLASDHDSMVVPGTVNTLRRDVSTFARSTIGPPTGLRARRAIPRLLNGVVVGVCQLAVPDHLQLMLGRPHGTRGCVIAVRVNRDDLE